MIAASAKKKGTGAGANAKAATPAPGNGTKRRAVGQAPIPNKRPTGKKARAAKTKAAKKARAEQEEEALSAKVAQAEAEAAAVEALVAKKEEEVKEINSPFVWAGLPGAVPAAGSTQSLFVHKASGDVNMQGLPPPTALQQAAIDRNGFDYRIPPGQPVACSEVKNEFNQYQLFLTLPLEGPHAIFRMVCPLCGIALRPHSFVKHFGKGSKCAAVAHKPAVRHHGIGMQKFGEKL